MGSRTTSSGKRVLDVGTFEGFWAFELERRGADVVALDVDRIQELDWPPRLRPAEDGRRGEGFELAKRALGSSVERIGCSIYDATPERLGGTFDLVFCGSVLIHLRDPMLALERMAGLCAGDLVFADEYSRRLAWLPSGGGRVRRRDAVVDLVAAGAEDLAGDGPLRGLRGRAPARPLQDAVSRRQGCGAAHRGPCAEPRALMLDRLKARLGSGPAAAEAPLLGAVKLRAIDHAFERLGCRTVADLGGVWAVDGGYTLYAIDRHGATRGVICDDDFTPPLTERAATDPRLELVEGNFGRPETVERIGSVDAVLLFDVLLHQVRPDWDQILAMYAPATRSFVLAGPWWNGPETVRLVDLGRERYSRVGAVAGPARGDLGEA